MQRFRTIGRISSITRGKLGAISPYTPYKRVRFDSRHVTPGDVFVALKGQRTDGHRFVEDALNRGAVAAIVSDEYFFSHMDMPVIGVPNPLHALWELARARLDATPDMKTIVVVGSVGKTTTKEMIAHLLGMRYTLYKTPGNYNTLISVPTEIINIPFGVPVAVFEAALHEVGDVDILGSIIKPSVAVITRIDAEHLEYLGSVDVVKRENLKILRHLRTDGWAVIPSSVAHDVQDMYSSASQTFITFGSGNYVDVSARSIRVNWEGTSFTISAFGETKRFHIPLIGGHYVTSVMATVSVGLIFDYTLASIEARLRTFEPVWGRMDVRLVGRKKIVFDAYNASPASMEEFLKTVGILRAGEKLMLVLGDMKELGEYSKDYHLKLVPHILAVKPEYLALVGPEMQVVYESMIHSGYEGEICHGESVEDVFDFVRSHLDDFTVLALKASRSVKLEEILKQVVMEGEPASDE